MNIRSAFLVLFLSAWSGLSAMQEQGASSFNRVNAPEGCDWLKNNPFSGLKTLQRYYAECAEKWRKGETCVVASYDYDRWLFFKASHQMAGAKNLLEEAEQFNCSFRPEILRMVAKMEEVMRAADAGKK